MSSKKPQPKRKQAEPSSAPEALQPSSDDDAPPAPKVANRGLALFEASVAETAPPAKHSGGGGNTCSIEGVVLRGSKIKAGSADKFQVTVAVTKIMASGCKDIVTTGVDGIAFSLAVKNLEASPEEKAKNKDAKGPQVLDVEDGNSRANFLGLISTSFYMEVAGVQAKGQAAPPVENCVPGTKVLITGLSSTYGKNGSGGKLFVNAKKMVPLLSEVGPGEAAQAIINEARSANAQASAAFLWSMGMKGFFGLTYSESSLQQQADVCKAKWEQLVSGAAAKCESIALSLGSDDTQATVVAALNAHASRIKGVSAEEAAGGAPIFFSDLDKDCITAYTAPLVQYNISPGSKSPDFSKSLFDPSVRDRVPNSFVEALISDIEFKGNLIQIDFRLFFVFDKSAAIAAADDEKNPVLTDKNSAASVKLTKRSVGPELVGTLVNDKIETAVKEVVMYANQAMYASVFPRAVDDVQLSGHFAATAGIDFIDGIKKVGVQVSESWLDQNMLDGTGVFIHEPTDSLTVIQPADKVGPHPTLKTAGYQALSEASFSLKNLKSPAGKAKAYYVVYSGVSQNVASTPAIATSVDAGESHLADVIPSARQDGDIKAFLTEDALVYVVVA
jgi:hypothetical protein